MASAHRIAAASARASLRSRADPGYVCLNCQLRALSTSRKLALPRKPNTASRSRYAPDDGFEGSFADKLRKKIWGSDNPPGQRNPYVRESPEEREERLAEEAEREAIEMEEADFQRMRKAGKDDVIVREEDIVDDVAEDEEDDVGLDATQGNRAELQEYVPATTWKGLRHIPGWKVAQEAPKPWFNGFFAPRKTDDPTDIERAIQRATVEVWVMKQALGSPLLPTEIDNPTADFEARLATGATFSKGGRSLSFTDPTLQEDIMVSLGLSHADEVEAEGDEEVFDQVPEDMIEGKPLGAHASRLAPEEINDLEPLAEEAVSKDPTSGAPTDEEVIVAGEPAEATKEALEESLPLANKSYRLVSFEESETKFAVLKRVMQLTGTRIPDPDIPQLNTAATLLAHLVRPPPATKLVDNLLQTEELISLPNVQLFGGRYTSTDKEKEIGRWKLIEEELTKRGLPTEMRKVKQEKPMPFDAPNPHTRSRKQQAT